MRQTFSHYEIGKGRVTACIQYPQPGDEPVVTVGLSFCSPSEKSFAKAAGRQRAQSRLKSVLDGKDTFTDQGVAKVEKPDGTTAIEVTYFERELFDSDVLVFTRNLDVHLRDQVWETFLTEVGSDNKNQYPGWLTRAAKRMTR